VGARVHGGRPSRSGVGCAAISHQRWPRRIPQTSVSSSAGLQRATHPPGFLAEVARVLHEGGLRLVIVIAAGANVRRRETLSGALFRMARKAPGWSAHTGTCARDEVVALLNAGGYAVIEEALLPGALALLARRRPATSPP
jgi:hypothetical protein